MLHNNKIIDSDAFFEVNAITRQIANKTPSKITLMQNDHNSERFSFSLPRFIEGHDLLEVDKAEVHFLNGESAGIYEMDDLAVDPKDESKVVCSWLLSNNATKKADSLIFLLKFTCFADDGITVDYVWHTALFQGISVSVGLDNSGTVAENYVDILEQWRKEFIQKEEKNTAGGVAGLDENGKISADQIPAGSGGGSITVDDALSDSSTNPPQNKVVTAALNKKLEITEASESDIDKLTNVGVYRLSGFGDMGQTKISYLFAVNSYAVGDSIVQYWIEGASIFRRTKSNPGSGWIWTEWEAINDYPSDAVHEFIPYIGDDGIITIMYSDLDSNIKGIHYPDPEGGFVEFASPKYVDDAIGDIETALENIISKYGLGGDSE